MPLPKENARTSAMREEISRVLSCGVSLASPMATVALGGLTRTFNPADFTTDSLRNVEWGAGGRTYGWRTRKTRTKATTGTGELKIRSVSQPDLHANPSITRYMIDQTWSIGEGDVATNRAAGETKILDIKKERMEDARQACNAEFAGWYWAPNETSQCGGLTMFSPTNVAASTTYAGIALNASATNGTDTFYYWKPTGYDYGSSTIAANLLSIMGSLQQQMTFSAASGGGQLEEPDFAVCARSLWPYILQFFESKYSLHVQGGTQPQNLDFLKNGIRNQIVINGVTLFWDDNFGGSTGYIDASATEEILMGNSKYTFLSTTNLKSEGLMSSAATDGNDEAWLAGQMGVIKSGMMCIGFKDPRRFQIAYT